MMSNMLDKSRSGGMSIDTHSHKRVLSGSRPDAGSSGDQSGNGSDTAWAFDSAGSSGLADRFPGNGLFGQGTHGFGPSDPGSNILTTTTVATAPVTKTTTVAATKGYTAATNQQWNMKALFGADPNATLHLFNGQGVHIGDYDNGIDLTNTALDASYVASLQQKIDGVLSDPTKGVGDHGTATAGIMVADASTNGGTDTGIAYGAGLAAVDIFDGSAASDMIATAKSMSNFDVTNNSWGWVAAWADPANVSGSFGQQFVAGVKTAADTGRAGLGTNVVKAAGNDWATLRSANASEFSADRHVTLVGAVWQAGDVASYSDRGSDLLVSSYGGIMTTDKTGTAGYSSGNSVANFDGTSAATPEVAATDADMLSANAGLGWRDVQNILALTATDTEATSFTTAATGDMAFGWTVNGANTVNGGGAHYSDDVGFGTENAAAAIREAAVWSYFTPVAQTSANEQHLSASAAPGLALTSKATDSFVMKVATNVSTEAVKLTLNVTDTNLDDLKVTLVSPDGTNSIVLSPSQGTQVANSFVWTLESQAFRGELSAGNWTVNVSDANATDTGKLNSALLDVYGSSVTAAHVFHYTDEAAKMDVGNASRLILSDATGVGDWIDTAATSLNETLDLHAGNASYLNGAKIFGIAAGTTVNDGTLGSGTDMALANNNGDKIVGGTGLDTFLGGTGNDTFYAGWGGGTMTGGAGVDDFAFNHNNTGAYTITDFTSGTDKIDLKGLGDSFAKLSFATSGSSLMVSGFDQAGDKLTLAGLGGHTLTASNFMFA